MRFLINSLLVLCGVFAFPLFASAQDLPPDALSSVVPDFRNVDLTTDFNDILTTIETRYGPLGIKSKTIGFDWQSEKSNYLTQVKSVTNTKDYFYMVARFLSEFDDAHISISLPSSLTYKLPLQFIHIDGKIVVNYVNAKDYPKNTKVPDVGDELIAINGVSPADYQKTQLLFNKNGNSLTNTSMFALQLGGMAEASGFPLSEMPVNVKLTLKSSKSAATQNTYDVALKYKAEGVGVIGRPVTASGIIPKEDFFKTETKTPDVKVKKEMTLLSQTLEGFSQLPEATRNSIESSVSLYYKINNLFKLGTKIDDGEPDDADDDSSSANKGQALQLAHRLPRFKLPNNFHEIYPGVVIPNPKFIENIIFPQHLFVKPFIRPSLGALFNSDNLFAGVFMHNGKRIGFLRVSSYEPKLAFTMQWSIRYFIGQLQKVSDVLIIDQTDNPGGDVDMSNLLIKSLVGKYDESKHLKFAVRPSQEFLTGFAEIIDAIQTNKEKLFTDQEKAQWIGTMKTEFDKVYNAYEAGDYLSEPLNLTAMTEFSEVTFDKNFSKTKALFLKPLSNALLGVNVLQEQVYTKPVFFLTNELDFSGGDCTPAVFQDYQRGPIVGVHTAGAGGTVEDFSHRGATEFSYALTTSLMVRKGGRLVENAGVTPDIPFAFTEQDITSGYQDTLERLLKTLHL